MVKTSIKFLLLLIGLSLLSAQESSETLDYVLIHGTVYDGLDPNPKNMDIGIKGDRIVALGSLAGRKAKKQIDLKGLVVQPGIIDAHTHSDFTALVDPGFEHALRQGVTTIVTGNCGMSGFPIAPENEKEVRETWRREGVEMPRAFLALDFNDYKNLIDHAKPKLNVAPLIGQGNIRNLAMGLKAVSADRKELKEEARLLFENLKEGAFGLSLGLPYLPGIYADDTELLELIKIVKSFGGVVTVHLKSEGYELEESVQHVISLARKSGATFVISHFKAAGTSNWDKFYPVLNEIQKARREEGLSIYITVYPYTASQTELASLLPNWFYSDPNRLSLLQDPKARERLLRELAEKKFEPGGLIVSGVGSSVNQEWAGKTIGDFSRARGLPDAEGLLTLLAENNFEVSVLAFGQHPYLVREALKQDFAMAVSDTIAELSAHPHPRVFGSFPVYMHDLSLDSSALPLGEAIRKVTALPAQVYGIQDRGVIRLGAFADLAVWDPAAYQGTQSYTKSRELAKGIRYLFVNGAAVIDNSKLTSESPGRALSK